MAVAPAGHGKLVSKKTKIMKMDTISLESITQVEFIKAILAIHNLSNKFTPGVHSGPNIKVWWTGVRYVNHYVTLNFYPKTFHAVAEKVVHHQFGIALEALVKKDKTKVQVSIELDLDNMEGFKIKQFVCSTSVCG